MYHPWEEPDGSDIKQPNNEEKLMNKEEKEKFKTNFMNSDENPDRELYPTGNMTPKAKTEGQVKKMKKTVQENYEEYQEP